VAVITSVEAEHLDTYGHLEPMVDAFVEFANKVPFYGAVVACLDDSGVRGLIPRIDRALITYGTTSQADLRADDIAFEGTSSIFSVTWRGEPLGRVQLQVPGLHNVRNALASLCVGFHLDLDHKRLFTALGSYCGVARRFDIRGEYHGVMVVDDYAHHPTEVAATLQSVRSGFDRRIVAVFQPHLFTRTRDFAEEFGSALLDSDMLIVTGIYPAREEPIEGVSGDLVAGAAREQGHRQVTYISEISEVTETLIGMVKEGDIVITMGAGDIWTVARSFADRLREEGPGG
jgi:UDP-N-acetylmuramate--alanine ligase